MIAIGSCRKTKKSSSCFALKLNNIESYTDESFHCFEYEINKFNNCGKNQDIQCPQNYGCDDSYTRSISSYNLRRNRKSKNKKCNKEQPKSHHHRRRRNEKDDKFDNQIIIGVNITKCSDLDVDDIYDSINDATTCGPLTIQPFEDKDDILGIAFDFKGDSLKFDLCLNDINYTNPGYVEFKTCGIESRPCIYDLLPDFCGMCLFTNTKTKMRFRNNIHLTII